MKALSELNRDELRNLLENIREERRAKGVNENGEPAKIWSNEDIDRLLGIAEKMQSEVNEQNRTQSFTTPVEIPRKAEEAVPVNTAEVKTVDISQAGNLDDNSDRIRSIFNDEAALAKKIGKEKKTVKKQLKVKGEKKSLFAKGAEFLASFRNTQQQEEERFFLKDDAEEFENDFRSDAEYPEDEDYGYEDYNEETVRIGDLPKEITDDEDENGKTKQVYLEKPGLVIKKGISKDDSGLEGAPTIISVEEAFDENSAKNADFKKSIREAEENGQITLPGFGDTDINEKPGRIEESEAEKELFRRRKAKIDSFVLFGDENENDPYGTDSEKERLGDLFGTHDERPRRKEEPEFVGVEYSQIKDARRVRRYLSIQKKKSLRRVMLQSALLVLVVAASVAAAAETTVAGDSILTIFSNFVTIVLSLITSNQLIVNAFDTLKKKKFNVNCASVFVALLCFIQTLLMFILYFFDENTVSVFAGAGTGALLMSEIASYATFSRTADALELCTGVNKDKLYSVDGITDDKDATELGKNVKSPSPRIRYSSKTRFPSHLIELCTSETRVDKNMRFVFLIIAVMSIVNFIVTWSVSGNFPVGFAALVVTFALCVPSYAVMLVQLPLRWANKSFNKLGGMISCQDAVTELCRTNAIILDSKDLFDQNLCSMHGFKDFKNVRVDDAMLYAAAMVIRSGGPLTGVFDQMVVNRRDILPTVKSFSYEERLGVSGWIYSQKVILGTRQMMINHNVDVPETIDEDKYLMSGHEVMYLAIANKLAAMMVVDYAPDRKLIPYLKKLRDAGVTVLVRNCDPNVTDVMISQCYDMRLDNIKILNSASSRVFKKYKSRPKVNSRAVAIHDGTTFSFTKTFCVADMLRHVFNVSNTMMLIGILMSFVIVLVLSIVNVVADLPAIFIILIQIMIAGAFTGIAKILSSH